VLTETYDNIRNLGTNPILNPPPGFYALEMSTKAKNPVPGGETFQTVVPDGDLTLFAQRWQWIDHPDDGMIRLWGDMATADRTSHVAVPLVTRAKLFADAPDEVD